MDKTTLFHLQIIMSLPMTFPLPTLAQIKNQMLAKIMNQRVSGMQIFTCPPPPLSMSPTHSQECWISPVPRQWRTFPSFPTPNRPGRRTIGARGEEGSCNRKGEGREDH